MTPWTEWTDEFLVYVEIHCETDRALFSWGMVEHLYRLADTELIYVGPPPAYIPMYAGFAMLLVKKARERFA